MGLSYLAIYSPWNSMGFWPQIKQVCACTEAQKKILCLLFRAFMLIPEIGRCFFYTQRHYMSLNKMQIEKRILGVACAFGCRTLPAHWRVLRSTVGSGSPVCLFFLFFFLLKFQRNIFFHLVAVEHLCCNGTFFVFKGKIWVQLNKF